MAAFLFIRAALIPWAKTAARDMSAAKMQTLHLAIDAAAQETLRNPAALSSPKQLERARLAATVGYYTVQWSSRLAEKWPLEDFPPRLLEMLEGAPLLDAGTRADLQRDFRSASAQLEVLASRLDFGDHALWNQIRP